MKMKGGPVVEQIQKEILGKITFCKTQFLEEDVLERDLLRYEIKFQTNVFNPLLGQAQ